MENATSVFTDDLSAHEVAKFYDDWARNGNYEKDSLPSHYSGPGVIAKSASTIYSKKDIKILDVAAGTGRVAEQLREYGFEQIDALDPAKEMLEVAKKNDLYSNYFCAFLDKACLQDKNGCYDCITVCGAFGKGHIPVCGLHDLIRLTKQGGHIIIAMREEYLYKTGFDGVFEPLMKQLENEKIWKMLSRKKLTSYAFGLSGILYVFQKS